MSSPALGELARLHVQSSADLMKTLRLLVPNAFSEGSNTPDLEVVLSSGDSILGVVSNLVELQMFHLLRAQAITAQLRMRVALKQQQKAASEYGAVSSSEGDSSAPVLSTA